ncbi:Spy/CpxP family protein refolding chaperone [Hymenobacter luteus]|uniref:Spy/CpxP family protein refolding chaperone n=2 Tax=Hymenobacter TaxID=89966 RepID=A0A7W9T5S1_9BACT|nr:MULTISPECIES: hypothetical protein [Hymenobacter]MBB4601497.1 Spy/CpxP family protein refolding chaperone [Hymenobacter latericoloratus]MBB6061455.1 Spy/CpxP family protein refolding chaperone [Hymenobacter luteus]
MKKFLAASLLLGLLAGATAPVALAQTAPAKTKVKAKKDKVKAKGTAEAATPAEGRGGPGGGRGGRGNLLAEMTKELNFTADQQTKVAAIQQEQMQQMKSLRASGETTGRQARMQQMRSLEESTDAKLQGVLTPEQFQQYQAKKQERMRRPGPQGGGTR